MEHMFKRYLCLAALFSVAGAFAASDSVITYFSPKSQSFSLPENVQWTNEIHRYDMAEAGEFYGTFAITPGYERSFRPGRLARCLFGDDLVDCNSDCRSIKISGSAVSNRGDHDWLADYFGLPTDFESTVSFKPRVDNFLVDFNLYLGLDNWWEGLYFRIHAPVVHTRWDLNMCESVSAEGVNDYIPGYFAGATVPNANLLKSFTSFVSGSSAPDLSFTGTVNDITFQKLCCSKIPACGGCDDTNGRLKKTRLSDIQMALGWDFWRCEDYYLGLNVRAAAPTGNTPEGKYLFEPIVGNGHHWELGGGLDFGYVLWSSEDEESHFGFYLDAKVTHLFKTDQHRSFDLIIDGKCAGNSRYMLASKFTSDVENLYAATTQNTASVTALSSQFANIFAPVANITCCEVEVSASVQGDVTAMFNYTCGNFTWDLGYNFFGRSCEDIDIDCDCPCIPKNTWALKGDAHVYGFEPVAQSGVGVPLSASESKATIHGGTNAPFTASTYTNNEALRNFGVDNAQFAYYVSTGLNAGAIVYNPALAGGTNTQSKTSRNPVFLSTDDLNLKGSSNKNLVHNVFTHLGYTWNDRDDCWIPYLGIGASAGFAQSSSDCNDTCDDNSCDTTCCPSCTKCGLSTWAVWLKAGVSFN